MKMKEKSNEQDDGLEKDTMKNYQIK